jgi:PAS domain S-box-containing protein
LVSICIIKKRSLTNILFFAEETAWKWKKLATCYATMKRAKALITFIIISLQWFSMAQANTLDSLLTNKERSWLEKHGNSIRYAPNPSWPPCDFVDKDGKHKGIIADYIAIFENKLGITFQRTYLDSWDDMLEGLKEKSIDFIGGVHRTTERDNYLFFTDQIFTIPLLIVVREEYNKELTTEAINTMNLACVAGYSSTEYIQQHFPMATIVECKDDLEALFKTSMGITDGTVIDLMVASHLVETYGFSNLSRALELDYSWQLRFGIRNDYPELRSILDKTLSTIHQDQRKAIFEKWVRIPNYHSKSFLERYVKTISISFAFLALIIIILISISIILKRLVRIKTQDLISSKLAVELREKQFRELFNTMTQGVVYQNPEGHIFEANPAAQKILGLTLDQLQGRTSIHPEWQSTHEDGSNFPGEDHPTMVALRTGQEVRDVVMYVFNPIINDKKCILVSAKPMYNDRNELAFVYSTFTDITIIKEAENKRKSFEQTIINQNKKLIAIVDSIPDKLFVHDAEGNFLETYTSNPKGFIVPVETVLGKSLKVLFGEELGQLNIDKIKECIATQQLVSHEFPFHFKGKTMYLEVRVVPFMEDKVIRFVRDITDRKIAEQQIKELNTMLENKVAERTTQLMEANSELTKEIQERLEIEKELLKAKEIALAANKAKSDFLATMSHEIRTPMNAILGYAELLSQNSRDKTQQSYLNSIKTSGRSLLTIINDILDLSKVEAGKLELNYDFVDTPSFFAEFEQVFAFTISEKGLLFDTRISSGVPNFIYVDAPRLRQVLLNIVGNAVKFTDHGSVTLAVSILNPRMTNAGQKENATKVDLQISITDTGNGIAKEFQQELFTPFAQAKGKTTAGGTGLGLAIAKRLVDLMGGSITVNSSLGKGSTFTINIPDIPYLTSYQNDKESLNIKPKEIIFEKACILIVDDIQQNRKFLIDVLSETKLEFLEAENGAEALLILSKVKPDLIITDIKMPEMDGFELLDAILQNKSTKHIPVIAYSASVMKEQIERISRNNFVDLLIKPLQITELYQTLMRYIPFISASNHVLNETNIKDIETSGENLIDFENLFGQLTGKYKNICDSFKTRQPLEELREFGISLASLGKTHNSTVLENYGNELVESTDNFDIDGILNLLKKYDNIVLSLNKSKK